MNSMFQVRQEVSPIVAKVVSSLGLILQHGEVTLAAYKFDLLATSKSIKYYLMSMPNFILL